MASEFTYLVNLLMKKEYHNKYLFVNNYVPSVMKRKGFDYIDSYKTSLATDNYFLFEKKQLK